MVKYVYSDSYKVELKAGHRFPMSKYEKLRQYILKNKILNNDQLIKSFPASTSDLYLAHDKEYVDQVCNLTLEHKKARRVGLPLTEEMVTRARVSIQSTLIAAELALKDSISGALSSGTHHAHYDQGEGFCFFNDFAIVSYKYSDKKILIIDLDVHHGNGNATLLSDKANTDIIDFFCETNYPFRKILHKGAYSIPKGAQDDYYLSLLKKVLSVCEEDYDLILYQAGVDALESDKLGQLNISLEGMKARDEQVFNFSYKKGIPIVSVIGGGYAKDIDQTVVANSQTISVAKKIYKF